MDTIFQFSEFLKKIDKNEVMQACVCNSKSSVGRSVKNMRRICYRISEIHLDAINTRFDFFMNIYQTLSNFVMNI